MRKTYPYLVNSYVEDANTMKKKRDFLKKIDNFVNRKQYVKITLLNWNEEPIKEIQGELTNGTLTKDGSTPVRRSCSFSAVTSGGSYSVEDLNMDFSLNKKIFLEIGVRNDTGEYKEFPILWFPQGVFFIGSFSCSSSVTSAVAINLRLMDKMCGLNGVVGGKLNAPVIFDEMDTQSPTGEYVTEKVLIYNIIQELVHHYGGEDLNNIVIEDVPLRIKRIMKWMGDNPIWMIPRNSGATEAGLTYYDITVDKPANMVGVQEYHTGDDVGYIYDDFVYDTELVGSPNDSVAAILDKIKQYLGNYEYFYDEFGVFHFREIKNYLNTTQAKVLIDDMAKKDYVVDVTIDKDVFDFTDEGNLISLNLSPQYENIKNDFTIHGERTLPGANVKRDIRYHLVIDKKPEVGNKYYDLLFYEEEKTKTVKATFPLSVPTEEDLPKPGNFNVIYHVMENNTFVYWEDQVYKEVNKKEYFPAPSPDKPEESKAYIPTDWRTELYLQGMLAKNNGTDAGFYFSKLERDYTLAMTDTSWVGNLYRQVRNTRIDTDYYFEELDAFWPEVYDLVNKRFYAQGEQSSLWSTALTDGVFYLDFIDPSASELGEYAVSNIGRRSDVVVNKDVNCLFQPEIPNIIFLNTDSDNIEQERTECQLQGQPYTQVKGEVYWAFATGGHKNGAYDQIKYELYLHTNYQKSVSVSALPAFYLEPNSRATISDKTTNTYGSFIIKNITIPLGAGGVMTATMNQVFERF